MLVEECLYFPVSVLSLAKKLSITVSVKPTSNAELMRESRSLKMDDYKKFLFGKSKAMQEVGFEAKKFHPRLFEYQKAVTKRALKAGRFCIWADAGLGKTVMQLAWADQIKGNVLVVAPLAVASQTIEEGKTINVEVKFVREQSQVKSGISITNYEMLHAFDPSKFKGLVLDESSRLAGLDGKQRRVILDEYTQIPMRLACSATPSPNDYMEIGSHAEFVGASTYAEMLSMFFVHDGGETQKWRLKGHAQDDFWKWVCSWAVMFRKPSDIGFPDEDFELPKLEVIEHAVDTGWKENGYYGLLPFVASSLRERIRARNRTVSERIQCCAELVNNSKEAWIVWCNLNVESDGAEKVLKDSVQIKGGDSIEDKIKSLIGFSNGQIRVMVSKPSITGFGLNWQHCHNVVFLGLSDSWQAYYQAVRRCWRFGQKEKVKVHIIVSTAEGAVLKNILRKEADAEKMMTRMVQATHSHWENSQLNDSFYMQKQETGTGWTMILGDCVEAMRKVHRDSIDFSVFSPPFASLYTYSASDRDMGNCRNHDEFHEHFKFCIEQLFRTMKPGRLVSFHCMNLTTSKSRDGYIGLRDFRGEMIRLFVGAGFIYHSEVCIWKDPVTAMQRTKAIGLLWKQLKKDSSLSRQGIADYLVTVRKPGDNGEFIAHSEKDFPVKLWQKWASPIWNDINPSDTLQYRSAREHKDERHIAPLQLEVIRRALMLWSNPDDLVLSPFAGIGSEGVVSLQCGRRFMGIELKHSYWKQACRNLEHTGQKQQTLLPLDIAGVD